MKHIKDLIAKRKQPVVWNPYENNDGLTRDEFIALINANGYKTVLIENGWVTAFQVEIKTYGVETLQKHLNEAVRNESFIYAGFLREEINKLNSVKFSEARY